MSKSPSIEIDLQVTLDTLERTRVQHSPEDHACLEIAIHSLVELARLVRERGTTIARIRRMFGLRTSEKLCAVFPGARKPANDEDSTTTDDDRDDLGEDERDDGCHPRERVNDGCASGDERGPSPDRDVPDGRAGAEGGGADAPRTRKGHGRIGAAAYRHARCTHVEHDHAHVGDTCPQCAHGRLYRLREPERIVRITGQPPLAAHTWELDRWRCSGCGCVFTAPAPPEAQGPKYDVMCSRPLCSGRE